MPFRRNRRLIIIAAIVVLVLALAGSAGFYTDLLWFREVGLTSVLWTSIRAQLTLGAVVGIVTAALIYVNLVVASRIAPVYSLFRVEAPGRADPMDRYRETLSPYVRWIRIAVALLVGLLAGISASASWQSFVLYLNRVPFGETDPQFGRDIGFYFFQLPFYGSALSWLWFAIVAALVLSLVAHYFHGSIRPEGGWRAVSSGAVAHASVLLGLLALVKAVQYYLGQFMLNFSPRGTVTGASYTDVHAQLPALKLLAIISIISALLFIVNIRFRRLSLPLAAVSIWILTAVLAGGVWPWWVQRFSVTPQEAQREEPFIKRNIEATRFAFGLEDVQPTDYPATETLDASKINESSALLQNVRVWDPDVLQQAYSQLQAISLFYTFPDVDIDRYEVAGETRQVLLSARELSIEDLRPESKTWSNVHLRYTHGFGIVASLANESTTAGQPSFLVKDVPGTVSEDVPAFDALESGGKRGIYYGESFDSSEYSIVNTKQAELDFEGGNDETQSSNYAGAGGIVLDGIFKRLAFALREKDPNMVLSGLITPSSKVMIYKNVRDRVLRAAPFLHLDSDPYVTAIDGRLQWVLDAYTTSPWYPYSQRFDLGDVVASGEEGALDGSVNYVRNSVKIAVDAYDGTMKFYVVDDSDPLIQAWRKVFPDLFTDEAPPAELEAHFRYPEDLFKAQSEVYLTYHMTDPLDFYTKSDEWAVASAGGGSSESVDPTYLLISLPGETSDEFVIARPFTPRSRPNLIGLMIGRSDPGSYGELLTLDMPSDKQVDGPAQINSLINQDEEISQAITLLSRGGSRVIFGNLVTLPIDDSLLYVQPLFIEASPEGATTGAVSEGIPELKRVILVYGEQVVQGDNFSDALATLFDLQAPPPVGGEPTPTPTSSPGGGGQTGGGQGGEPNPELAALVDKAGRVYDQAQQALSDGDFQRYGQLIERLGNLLARAGDLSGDTGGGGGGR